jgi:hypothetical protein
MEFKENQRVYYQGRLSTVIGPLTPEGTVLLSVYKGGRRRVPVQDVREPLDYLSQTAGDYTPVGLGRLIERAGMDHGSLIAIRLVGYCLEKGLNLCYCWANIRFYIHDIFRQGKPEWCRETVYTNTIQELCDAVNLIARKTNEEVSG